MTAPELSEQELAEVRRFGLDKPEPSDWDDSRGIQYGFGVVLAGILAVALIVAAIVACASSTVR